MKPHYGRIKDWTKVLCWGRPDQFIITGTPLDHPDWKDRPWNWQTSILVSCDEATGEIETLNSRYTLVGPERHPSADRH